MLTEKNSPEPRPMEVRAPFSKRKRRRNPASLNRRESYIHKKMNASDFFHFCLETFWLTLVIVAVYRNWDIFGLDVSIFVSSGPVCDETVALNFKFQHRARFRVETRRRFVTSN